MKNRIIASLLLTTALFAGSVSGVKAQSRLDDASHHRQGTKNQWRNVGIGAGALGIYGLLKHDNALTIAGLGGSAYSFSRYEHDRRSQSKIDRARAARYSRHTIYQNGHRYTRRTVVVNGQRSYRYIRS